MDALIRGLRVTPKFTSHRGDETPPYVNINTALNRVTIQYGLALDTELPSLTQDFVSTMV